MFKIFRKDVNRANQTFGMWCFVTSFNTFEEAIAFVQRANPEIQLFQLICPKGFRISKVTFKLKPTW